MRVIDALAVHKDAEGEMEVVHLSNLTKEEAIEFGSKVAALIGLGIEGEKGWRRAPRSVRRWGRRGFMRSRTRRRGTSREIPTTPRRR